ncbi:MAG: UDP-N-acetylmuramoyl-L-alanine--D-glutamate ligase [Patescibacteria group bacterium]
MNNYFKGKKITVMGLGILGRGVGDVKFLAESDADLIVTDLKSSAQLRMSLQKLREYKNIKYVLGKHDLKNFRDRDMVLKSAGVPLDSSYIKEAKKNKIPIEMSASLVAKLSPATIIGITGTRGKSTVTQMIYEVLKINEKQRINLCRDKGLSFVKRNIFLGGNIRGIATLPLLKKAKKGDIIVMELDSWQLQGFGDSKISPRISVFTNLLSDHMNYYNNSMVKYFKDKANIYKYQRNGDYLIAGKEIAKKIKRKSIVPKSLPKNWKLKIVGEHNRENASFAADTARIACVPQSIIKKVIENFKGVEGRLEYIKTIRGIKIYNDNNATTPDATIVALKTLGNKNKNIVLIIGGADKGLDISKLIKEIQKYCNTIILLSGTGTDKLKNEARIMNQEQRQNHDPLFIIPDLKIIKKEAKNLKIALLLAMKNSKNGNILLFSPAFASFGMFKNEYDRNDKFINLVKKLK